MNLDAILVLLSILTGVVADLSYYQELNKPGHPAPNRWSWLIWAFSSYVEVTTFHGVSGDVMKTIPLATTPIACTVLLYIVWKMKEDKWESRLDALTDICSVVASFVAILLWFYFQKEWWAHVVAITAVPVSYFPTWRMTPKESNSSALRPWVLWTIMDTLNLALSLRRLNDLTELPYIVVELTCHTVTWFLISSRRHT